MSGFEQLIRGLSIAAKDKKEFRAIGVKLSEALKKTIKEVLATGEGLTPISPNTPQFHNGSNGKRGGKKRPPSRKVKRGGGTPLIDTYRLLNSISTSVTVTSSTIKLKGYSRLRYALSMHDGGTNPLGGEVPERPYMDIGIEKFTNSAELQRELENAAEKHLRRAGLI